MAKRIKKKYATLTTMTDGRLIREEPTWDKSPGDAVVMFLSAVVAMAYSDRATIDSIGFNTLPPVRFGDVSTMPCRLDVSIRCETFPNFGAAYGDNLADARAFSETMMEFWTKRTERLDALMKSEVR